MRRSAADCFFEGAAGEELEIGYGAVEGEDGAGEGFGGADESAATVRHSDCEGAQGVGAVGHAGGGDAVRDEDGFVLFEAEPETDECGGDVDAVADEL